jgi:hypothetical protein
MRLNIPPIVSYVFGAILVVFGVLRVKYLAAPRPAPGDDDAESSTQGPAVRGKVQQRHLRWGVIYVLLGLFLIISTYYQTHLR